MRVTREVLTVGVNEFGATSYRLDCGHTIPGDRTLTEIHKRGAPTYRDCPHCAEELAASFSVSR